jgi:hypothetical protein
MDSHSHALMLLMLQNEQRDPAAHHRADLRAQRPLGRRRVGRRRAR